MAIPRSFIASLGILFAFFVLFSGGAATDAHAQQLRVISQADGFTDYELVNERLKITAPEYLVVPWSDGQARYRVMEQEIVPVRADSTQMHYVHHPGQYLIAGRDTPVIQTGQPGYTRGQMVAPLTIHIARQNEPQGTTFQVIRHMRIRVFEDADAAVTPRLDRAAPSARDDASLTASLTADSPLANGQWYRIPITEDNIYTLDSDYLEDLGISVSQIDPRNIQIWTTPGYELPHRNSDPRPQLAQIPIIVEGESDGSFDSGDRVIFYSNGPNRGFFNTTLNRFEHRLHPYSRYNYVYLTIGQAAGLRLGTTPPQGSATRDVTEFRDFRWLEQDREKSESRIKSGTQWFGQGFDPLTSASQTIFTDTLAGFRQGSNIEIWVSMGGRSTSPSRFSFTVNGSTALPDLSIPAINSMTSATGLSAQIRELRQTLNGFSLNNDVITIGASFQNPESGSRGWVNWVRIRADRALQATGNRLDFHPPDDGDGSLVRYRLTGFTSQPIVLDITDPAQPVRLQVSQSGNAYTVTHSSARERRFLAQSSFRRPESRRARSQPEHPQPVRLPRLCDHHSRRLPG